MPDIKPPRLAGSEAETLHALLQYQRDSLVRKVAGLDDRSARWSPVGTGTSLLWLVKHMTRAEVTWVLRRFAGHDVAIPGDQPGPGETLDAVTAAYRKAWQQVDRVAFAGPGLDELCQRPDAANAGTVLIPVSPWHRARHRASHELGDEDTAGLRPRRQPAALGRGMSRQRCGRVARHSYRRRPGLTALLARI